MKIAVLGTRGFPDVQGGVERHCEELYPRLARLGCEVIVFTRTPYIPQEARRSEWNGVRFVNLWCPKTKALEAITHSLLGVLRTRGLSPDILHIHAVGPALVTPLARLLGIKVVMTHHGPDYERDKWGGAAKMVLKRGEACGVNYCNRVISISRGITEQIRSKFGKEAVLIPNGVNIPVPVPPGKELRRWELEPGGYVFTACRFVPEKGLHDLIEAYGRIKNPPFKVVIAGGADHETEYSRSLKRLAQKTDGVVLTGFVSGDRLGELFSNAGLFVLPSYYEGLPIALLEALSYGLPVLASDIAQHKEVPLGSSRYFKKGDVADLSKSLMSAFSSGITDEERNEYLALVKSEYNWDNIASRTFEVYKSVLE